MSIFTCRNLADAAVGAVLSLAVVIPVGLYTDVLEPSPYSDVKLRNAWITKTHIDLSASFVKNDSCTFDKLGAFGNSFEGWIPLRWEDIDPPQGDRLEGHHTINLRVFFDGAKDLDLVEVRTRHLCGDDKVDKVDKVFLSQQLN